MAAKKRQRTQKTKPRGIDPATGEKYEPTKIPVPKRGDVDRLLDRATKRQTQAPKS